jgi:hypothetical protein
MSEGEFVFRAIILVHLSPVAPEMSDKVGERGLRRLSQSVQSAGRCDNPAGWKSRAHAAPKNPASLAVARYCGIGSSSLNAEVKALERLHIVRGLNSSCCGLK